MTLRTLAEIKVRNKISNIKENYTEISTRISVELVSKRITGLLVFYKSSAGEGRYFPLLNTNVCVIALVQHFVMKLTFFGAATKALLTLIVIL